MYVSFDSGEWLSSPLAEDLLHLQLQLRSLPTLSIDIAADGPTKKSASVADPLPLSAAAAAAAAVATPIPVAAPAGWQHRLKASLPQFDGRFRGLVLLNIMTLVMASNWSIVKSSADAATMTDATIFMTMRFTLAAAVLAPFLVPHVKKIDEQLLKAGVMIGGWYAAGYVTQAVALGHTAASRASLLSTFTVLAVPMIAGLNGHKIRPVVWACAAAALVGTGMLEQGSSLPPNIGDALSVASALLFAAQIFTAERTMRAVPQKSEVPLMAVSMVTVAALSALATAALHAHDLPAAADGVRQLLSDWRAALPAALGGGGWEALPAAEAAEAARTFQQLVYTAVVSTDMVLLVELVALQDVTSTDAAMIYSLEPVVGAMLAYLLLGERWGPWGWAGGGLILAASMLTQLAGATDDSGGGGGSHGGAAREGGGAEGVAASSHAGCGPGGLSCAAGGLSGGAPVVHRDD